jgi:hypothetical protein
MKLDVSCDEHLHLIIFLFFHLLLCGVPAITAAGIYPEVSNGNHIPVIEYLISPGNHELN